MDRPITPRARIKAQKENEEQSRARDARERALSDALAQHQERTKAELSSLREATARELAATQARCTEQVQSLQRQLDTSREQHLQTVTRMREILRVHQSRAFWRKLGSPWSTSTLAAELFQAWNSPTSGDAAPDSQSHAPASAQAPQEQLSDSHIPTSIAELLSREDDDFVSCMYLALLGRTPDPEGYRFYLDQLRRTGDKADILAQVASSSEAKRVGRKVSGSRSLLLRRKLARFPVLRWLVARARATPPAPPMAALFEEVTSAAQIATPDVTRAEEGSAAVDPHDRWSCVAGPAVISGQAERYPLTRVMHFLWSSRRDLRRAFDIAEESGRLAFLEWFVVVGIRDCGLTTDLFPPLLLEQLLGVEGPLGEFAAARLARSQSAAANALGSDLVLATNTSTLGANLIGYAFGEFGRGEDVRMVGRSLDRVGVPFVIINQDPGAHGTRDESTANWVSDRPEFPINVFLINADLFPFLPYKLGTRFSAGRYTIGYWAWELSEWPADFALASEMVDEVWAISTFVADSVKTRAAVPVLTMPNAVAVPPLGTRYSKSNYGLPSDSFVFYFIFDAASHIERKNPIAVVRAFKSAFAREPAADVHLLIKAMNVDTSDRLWRELLEEVGTSEHVSVITERFTREDVLGLHVACDAFVSLHRSEGFGRCIAEAMAYGKPVIVTNYSGSRDFAKEGTACLVDYQLIPVPADAYPFSTGQVWAEPDVKQAASLMRRLAYDVPYRREMAEAGQRYVLEHFSEEAVGRLYAQRLAEIRASMPPELRECSASNSAPVRVPDEIFGYIDSPTPGSSQEVADVLSIEGWATSHDGIDSVRVFVDGAYVADAHYGILRPDVHKAFADFCDSGRSGFCLRVDAADYPAGAHNFRVVARRCCGAEKTWDGTFTKTLANTYFAWTQKMEELHARELSRRNTGADEVASFTIVVRLDASLDTALLAETFASLEAQAHPGMELLCLLAGEQQRGLVRLAAQQAKLSVEPVCVLHAPDNWISALSLCRGAYLSAVEPGDAFKPLAFCTIDRAITDGASPDLVYADEETRQANEPYGPIFKPAWSPVFLESFNYVGRPWFASRAAIVSVQSGRSGADDAIDEHELLRSIGMHSSAVAHVPAVLMSRRTPSVQSPAHERKGARGDEIVVCSRHPKVSIIVPTALRDDAIISRCFDSLEHRTDYPNYEVIVVSNNVKDPAAAGRHLGARPFKQLQWNGIFNWAAVNNFGAARSTGELLLFMNDDVEPIGSNWLLTLVHTLLSTRAGVSGCLLRYPNGTIQHAGVNFVNYGGGARHLFRFCTGSEARLQWLLKCPREVSAVTGACLLTARECFNETGGFDESLPLVGNDTDYCLRVWERGRPVVLDPHTQLIHYEGISRGGIPEVQDVETFWSKWRSFLERGDPFTNPNLDMTRDDWSPNPNIEKIPKVRIRKSLRTDRSQIARSEHTRAPKNATETLIIIPRPPAPVDHEKPIS